MNPDHSTNPPTLPPNPEGTQGHWQLSEFNKQRVIQLLWPIREWLHTYISTEKGDQVDTALDILMHLSRAPLPPDAHKAAAEEIGNVYKEVGEAFGINGPFAEAVPQIAAILSRHFALSNTTGEEVKSCAPPTSPRKRDC